MNSILENLCNTDGVSGREDAVRDYIIEMVRPYADKIQVDSMGNLYVSKNGTAPCKKIMLCAHMDEVGMIVASITDEGYIKFKTVGGIDESVLVAKRVRIGENKVLGVTGIKAVHLLPKEKRKEKVNYEDMYIDIGALSKDDALKKVKIGDPVYFETKAEKLGDLIKGKAVDDRSGCYVLMELLKENYKNDVCFVFTVQEEVGLRGAGVAARFVKPDECIVVDCTTCLDMIGKDDFKVSTHMGEGVAITIVDSATFVSKTFREELTRYSEKYQYKNVSFGGNDAGAVHINNIKTAALSVPGRYIHSQAGVVSPEDIDSLIKTLSNYLKETENA